MDSSDVVYNVDAVDAADVAEIVDPGRSLYLGRS